MRTEYAIMVDARQCVDDGIVVQERARSNDGAGKHDHAGAELGVPGDERMARDAVCDPHVERCQLLEDPAARCIVSDADIDLGIPEIVDTWEEVGEKHLAGMGVIRNQERHLGIEDGSDDGSMASAAENECAHRYSLVVKTRDIATPSLLRQMDVSLSTRELFVRR